MTATRPIARALRALGIAGFLAVIATEILDKPDSLPAMLGFVAYCALALIATAALEGGDTVTEPQACLTPDPFEPDDSAGFAARVHPKEH